MKCKVCFADGTHKEFLVVERLLGLGHEFRYMQCGACRCLQIIQAPQNLHIYYPGGYYSLHMKKWSFPFAQRLLTSRNMAAMSIGGGILGRLLNTIKKSSVLPQAFVTYMSGREFSTKTRILDVGCGDGTFLKHLSGIGFKSLLGIDPILERSSEPTDGLRLSQQELSETDGEWDVIVFNHSFEHMEQPETVLKNVQRLLAPDGVCMIRIPVVPCYAWSRYRSNWVQLDAPRHLFIHSEQSMAVLAHRTHLKIEEVIYDSGAYQILGSERYQSAANGNAKKTRGLLKAFAGTHGRCRAAKIARRLNRRGLGDQAAFFLSA